MSVKPFYSQPLEPYKKDYNKYWELIETYHPNDKLEGVESLKDSLMKEITHQTTLLEFYSYLSLLNSRLNCGHTHVYLPKNEIEALSKKPILLPYLVKVREDSIFAFIKNKYRYVTAINGEKGAVVLKRIRRHIPSDNGNVYNKNYLINKSFHILYYLYVSQTTKYSIKLNYRVIDVFGISYSDFAKIDSQRMASLSQLYRSKILLKKDIGYLNIGSFDLNYLKSEGINPKKIVESFFKTVEKENISKIILDLRNNTGGQSDIPMFILKYLAKKPYSFYESVMYKRNDYTPYCNLKKSDFKSQNNGYIRRKNFDYLKKQPVLENTYKGLVYVLINNANVSMAVAFTKKLMNVNPNTILIGQNVGGNFNFNAGNYVQYDLDSTKIKAVIPIENIKVDSDEKNYIIMPNLYIEDKQILDGKGEVILTSLINLIKHYNLWDGKQ